MPSLPACKSFRSLSVQHPGLQFGPKKSSILIHGTHGLLSLVYATHAARVTWV